MFLLIYIFICLLFFYFCCIFIILPAFHRNQSAFYNDCLLCAGQCGAAVGHYNDTCVLAVAGERGIKLCLQILTGLQVDAAYKISVHVAVEIDICLFQNHGELKMGRYFQRRTSGKIIVALGWNVKAIFQRGVPLARRPSDQNQKGGPGVSGPPL